MKAVERAVEKAILDEFARSIVRRRDRVRWKIVISAVKFKMLRIVTNNKFTMARDRLSA